MSEKQVVVKAASDHRDYFVQGSEYKAVTVEGSSTVVVFGTETMFKVKRPDDYVADDVEYDIVAQQDQVLKVK